MGRIIQRANPDEAFRILKAEDKMFRQSTQTNLYAAHTAVQVGPIKSHISRTKRRL